MLRLGPEERGGRSVANRRIVRTLVSGALFVVVAFVAGFIAAAFTDSWVWPIVVGAVAGATAEWVYVAVVWKTGRGPRGGSGDGSGPQR
jgi:hypothetical protein